MKDRLQEKEGYKKGKEKFIMKNLSKKRIKKRKEN